MPLTLHRYERRRLRLLASMSSGTSVLDIGFAQMPNPFLAGMFRTGIDIAPNRTSIRYDEELQGDVFDLHKLLPGRRFDTVILGEFIEHVERPYDLLRYLRGSITPGGRILISTPNPVSWPCLLFEWFGSRSWFYSADHTYYFPPRWVRRLLHRTSYSLVRTRAVGLWLPGVTLPCPVAWSYQVIYHATPCDPAAPTGGAP